MKILNKIGALMDRTVQGLRSFWYRETEPFRAMMEAHQPEIHGSDGCCECGGNHACQDCPVFTDLGGEA